MAVSAAYQQRKRRAGCPGCPLPAKRCLGLHQCARCHQRGHGAADCLLPPPPPCLGLDEAQEIDRPRQQEQEPPPALGIGLDEVYEAERPGPPEEEALYDDEQEIEVLEQRLAEEGAPNPEPAFGGGAPRPGGGKAGALASLNIGPQPIAFFLKLAQAGAL